MNICPHCNHRGDERICPRDGYPMVNEEQFADAPMKPDLLGKVFAERYEVEGLLGEGGMGWVFKARHVLMGHHVALKVMRKGLASDLNAVKRFYHEAKACSRLTQPHTIKVHDFGASSDGYLYIAMELLVGRALKDAIESDGPMPVVRVVHVARQVCKSLGEAHSKGMIHRDLKPENIYLAEVPGERDYVKLLDFGIAKFIAGGPRSEDLTKAGVVVGTPKYMSPEQAKGAPLTHSSDLYSLGVILYEMITGRVPFESDSTVTLLIRHASEPAPPVPAVVGQERIPERLRNLVSAMLEKVPTRRPATAMVIEESLMQVLDQIGVSEHRVGALAQAAAEAAAKRSAQGGSRPGLARAQILAPAAAPLVTGGYARPIVAGGPRRDEATMVLASEAPAPDGAGPHGGLALRPALAEAGTRLVEASGAAVDPDLGETLPPTLPSAHSRIPNEPLDLDEETTTTKKRAEMLAAVPELGDEEDFAGDVEAEAFEPTIIDYGNADGAAAPAPAAQQRQAAEAPLPQEVDAGPPTLMQPSGAEVLPGLAGLATVGPPAQSLLEVPRYATRSVPRASSVPPGRAEGVMGPLPVAAQAAAGPARRRLLLLALLLAIMLVTMLIVLILTLRGDGPREAPSAAAAQAGRVTAERPPTLPPRPSVCDRVAFRRTPWLPSSLRPAAHREYASEDRSSAPRYPLGRNGV